MFLWATLVLCIIGGVLAVPIPRPTPLNPDTNGTYEGDKYVCLTDDILYRDGDILPTEKGRCEKCVCRAPDIVCSPMKCEKKPGCRALQRSNQCCPEYQCECERDGHIYNNGEKLESPENPCEVCYCRGGEVVCTLITCYKRDDCQPQEVPGRCCPKYDHCPPIMDNRDNSHLMTLRPTIQTTSFRFMTPSIASSLSTNSVHGRHPSLDDTTDDKYDTTTKNRYQLLGELHPDTYAPSEGTTDDPIVTVKSTTVTKRINEETKQSGEGEDVKSTMSLPNHRMETMKYAFEPKVESLPITTEVGSEDTNHQEADNSSSDVVHVQATKEFGTETEDITDEDNVPESSEHSIVQVTKYPETEMSEGYANETAAIEKLEEVDITGSTVSEGSTVQPLENSSEEISVGQKTTTHVPARRDEVMTEEDDVIEESSTTSPINTEDTNSTEITKEASDVSVSEPLNNTTPVTHTSEAWEHHRPTQMVTDDIQYVTTIEPMISMSGTQATTATSEVSQHDTRATETISQGDNLGESDNPSDVSTTEIDNGTTTEPDSESTTFDSIKTAEENSSVMRYNRLGETDIDLDNNGTGAGLESRGSSLDQEFNNDSTTIDTPTDVITERNVEEESTSENAATESGYESTTVSEADNNSSNESTTELPYDTTERTNPLSSETTTLPVDVDVSISDDNYYSVDHLTTETNGDRDQLPVLKLSEEMTHHQMDFVIHHINMPAESDESIETKLPALESVKDSQVSVDRPTTSFIEVINEVVAERMASENVDNHTVSTATNLEVEVLTTDTPLKDVLETTTVEKENLKDETKDNENPMTTTEKTDVGTTTENDESYKELTTVVPDNATKTDENDETIISENTTEADVVHNFTEQTTIAVTKQEIEITTTNTLEGSNTFSSTAAENQDTVTDNDDSVSKEFGDLAYVTSELLNTTQIAVEDENISSKIEVVETTTQMFETTELSRETDKRSKDTHSDDNFSDSIDSLNNTTDTVESVTQLSNTAENTEEQVENEKLTLSTVLPEELNTEIPKFNITEENANVLEEKMVDNTSTESETSSVTMDASTSVYEVLITVLPTLVSQATASSKQLSDNAEDTATELTTLEIKSNKESIVNGTSGIDKLIKFNEQFMSNRTTSQSTIPQLTEEPMGNEGISSTTEGGITDNLAWVHLLHGKQEVNTVDKSMESSSFRETTESENAIQNSTFFLITPENQQPTGVDDTRFLGTLMQNLPLQYEDSIPKEDKREVTFTDGLGNSEENPVVFQDPNIYNSNTHTILTNLQRDDAHELGRYDLALLQNFFKNLYIHDDHSDDVLA